MSISLKDLAVSKRNRYGELSVKVGKPLPLGAHYDGCGVNFALYSAGAEAVELCLFDTPKARRESIRIPLEHKTNHTWHVYIEGLSPGQLYGYRVQGAYNPEFGQRFNARKVLLDPYAKSVVRHVKHHDTLYGYKLGNPRQDLAMDNRDNAAQAPLAMVVEKAFTWGDDVSPNIPMERTVVLECHVRGCTMQNPDVPPELRGTYAGMAHPAMIDYFKSLGVTTIELLPVHAFMDEPHLAQHGLQNYWGYNTMSYFAPHPAYATSPQQAVQEFKSMVRALHKANLEVVLDVVYNHTCEGNHMGPTISWKGIDNANYYRTVPDSTRFYMDFTGCGNTIDTTSPPALTMILDSLRYWVTEMHVDGFRFDLTSALAREHYDFSQRSAFFQAIHQDPILQNVKCFAEPWDVGMGGYQVGNYPTGWSEWNGRYRDIVRAFWNQQHTTLNQLATRLAGSSDLFQHNGRHPYNSLNFVTCHDGFTLEDLVSYNYKHNEANCEENRDGTNDNRSYNGGVEGTSTDPAILAERQRRKRNIIATLLFSIGTPMLLMGDERNNTQHGNNNTYCQDNPIGWVDWKESPTSLEFREFVTHCLNARRLLSAFQRRTFFTGNSNTPDGVADLTWWHRAGRMMSVDDWHSSELRSIAMLIDGKPESAYTTDEASALQNDSGVLLLINDEGTDQQFYLPALRHDETPWKVWVDTATPTGESRFEQQSWLPHTLFPVEAKSVVLLVHG
jgi:isoamylase